MDKRNINGSIAEMHGTINQKDKEIWDRYIANLYSSLEHTFRPTKGRDTGLASKLDLHGMTIQQAFHRVGQFVDEHFSEGSKLVMVVTGKSGKIADEFPAWCQNLTHVRRCEAVMDSQGDSGAWLLHLRSIRRR
jgi:hypothetical protein